MPERKYGVAMYTVHQSAERDLYETFCKLGEIGYQGIEFYGEPVVDQKLLARALKDSRLSLTGWHTEWRNLQENSIERTCEYLLEAGCPIAVIPCLGGKWQVAHGPEQECEEIWKRYTEQINGICEKLKRKGLRTGYHNHDHEFSLHYSGKPVFDLLFDGLSEDVVMEFDSGNCIEGGDDPLRVLKKYHGRDMVLHLKPYSHKRGFQTVLGDEDDANDWEQILDLKNASYLWMLVESENDTLPEFENAKRCLERLKKYL